MKILEIFKNFLKGIFTGIICFTLANILIKHINGNFIGDTLIFIITVLWCGICFCIFSPSIHKIKNMNLQEKQIFLKIEMNHISLIIKLLLIALIICIVKKFIIGILICLSFIVALLLIRLGGQLAYKTLKKDITLINQKLKEKNNLK